MSLTNITLLLFVALLLFGPEDLPVIARTIGKAVYQVRKLSLEVSREFQNSINTSVQSINGEQQAKNNSEESPSGEENRQGTEISETTVEKEKNPLTELPKEIVAKQPEE
jgi:sec-independent protein translocase protein TatA